MLDWQMVQNIIISLALGAVVGLERQSHSQKSEGDASSSTGVRTFSLASLLGTVSAIASENGFPGLVYLTGAGYFLMILAYLVFQFRQHEGMPGITTEVAALILFVLGVLVPYNPMLAAALGVIVAAILSVKRYTHGAVEQLSQAEILATMKFLLLLVVLLPILPDASMGPGGIYNPRELGYLVVLISAISFVGYFAIRFMGKRRGIALTGALGGLASSTAVTLSMCARVKETGDARDVRLAATFAIIVANAIMPIRLAIAVAVINLSVARALLLPLLAVCAPGLAIAGLIWWKLSGAGAGAAEAEDGDQAPDKLGLTNPFRLVPAIKFGLVFVMIIGLVYLARVYFGQSGTYIASFISGLAGVDAISIALARMEGAAEIAMSVAVRGIILAVLANAVTKIGMSALLGSKKLGLYVTLALLPILAIGVVELLLLG
jgi:uncharacterized membrane protein (DUF4010 family)